MRVEGERPGTARVRLARVRPSEHRIDPARGGGRPISPALLLVVSFLALIAAGTVLLLLPVSRLDGAWGDPLTALFTATSAACVTGLVVVDTADTWSGFGQVVILLLIQAGGFGIMAGSTLLLQVLLRRGSRLRDRVLIQETAGVANLGDVTRVLRRVALFTLSVELTIAVVLALAFWARGAVSDLPSAAWWGVFHAVSAFNNAGFDLVGGFQSLIPYQDDPVILVPVGVAIVLGGLGYAIVSNAITTRHWRRLAVETRIVLATSAVLLVGGAIAIALLEWDNPATLGAMDPGERLLNAAFLSTSLRTAGFTAVDIGALAAPTLFLSMALMFIGGASGSTAGGIKVNTFSLLLATIISTARGLPDTVVFGRRVAAELVSRALAVALLSVAVVGLTGFVLAATSRVAFDELLFEAVSALATVGLSTGITPGLDAAGQLVLIAAMFVGRLGPLTLVLAFAARQRQSPFRPALETVRIG